MDRFALIADDLTGALDAGAGFARAGARATLPFSGDPADAHDAGVVLINTETREGTAAEAYARTRQAAERLHHAGVTHVYKKIDSVLRGHPGPELAAVLDVFGGRALVAPAFPAQGRTTAGGVQFVHGQPAPAHHGRLEAALVPATDRCDLHDATSDDDLRRIARMAARAGYRVWCGTAGLAACMPDALGLVPSASPPAAAPVQARRLLLVAGTAHPATLAQIQALLAAGWLHLSFDPHHGRHAETGADLRDRLTHAIAARHEHIVLAPHAGYRLSPSLTPRDVLEPLEVAVQALPLDRSLGLIVTGGETASHICRALGARAIQVVGEALPGIPLGWLELPGGKLVIATKSGGFGAPDALLCVAETMIRPVAASDGQIPV